MTRVLVLGDALLDVHATPAEPIRPGADVPAVVRLGVGGQGANLAVRLARRGLEVRLACAVGDDDSAPLVRDRLARAGVTVVPIPAGATGAVVILLDTAGERTMLSHRVPFGPAAASRLPSLAADVGWVIVSGYLLEEPGPILEASATGAARRAVVGSPFRDADAFRAALEALAPDLLILNVAEARALAPGSEPAEAASALAARIPSALVVVTEATGAAAAAATMEAPVVITTSVDPAAVDTTGAGDAFAATLLAAIIDDFPPASDALRMAMERAATIATAVSRVVGAQASVSVGDGST